MRDIRVFSILFLLLFISFKGYSQEENWEKPAGSIEDAKVVIEKDKVINLRPVSRRFKSIQIELPRPQALSIDYNLTPTVDTLSSLQVIVRPKTMRDQPLEKLYGLNAKLGYGNYRSPVLLIDAGNKRNDEYMYNVHLNHFSSGRGAVNDAPYYFTGLDLDGKFYLNNVTLFADAGFNNQSYRMYGYNTAEYAGITDKDYLKQRLNILNINIGLEDNNAKNSSDQVFEVGINFLKNNHFEQEFSLGLNYNLDWNLATDWKFKLPVSYNLNNQNNTSTTTISRHLVGLRPEFGYILDSFTFTFGVNGFFQKDPADNLDSRFFVFPNLGVRYAINEHHGVSFRVNGEVEQVSLNSMYRDNLYLDTLLVANNNINNFNAAIDLQGNVSESFGYAIGYSYANYRRMMFFDNNPVDTARFRVLLDNSGVTRHRFNGKVNYIRNENLDFSLGAAYNIYSTSDLQEAWHKPQFELDFGSRITIIDKLHVRLDYRLLSGIKARNSSGLVKTLDMINDLNIGLDLDVTANAGLFLEFRNIIGQNYQLYNNYPVNGFQFQGGFSIRF